MLACSASDAAHSVNADIGDAHFLQLFFGLLCLPGIFVHLNNSGADRKARL
jgi:hypothetical protein